MPFKALFVAGLCALISAMTSAGHWWFQWVALAKGLRAALVLGLLALAGGWLYRRYGAAARDSFSQWAADTQPRAADVLRRVMSLPTQPAR